MSNRYSPEEDAIILQNMNTMRYEDIGAIIGRSRRCVSERLRRIGVRKTRTRPIKSVPGYTNWASMIQRCTNPNEEGWRNYGGRGIRVCDEWIDSFKNFLRDMGEKPPGGSIDRIDPNGNYCKENCRWIPISEQGKTTRKYLSNGPCKICHGQRACHNGRCHRCGEYFRRNGVDRPLDEALIRSIKLLKIGRAASKSLSVVNKKTGEIRTFLSQREAATALGVSFSAINALVMGKVKVCAGHTLLN